MNLFWKLMKPFFSEKENWGDSSKVDPLLLFLIFRIREKTGVRIHINNAWTDGTGHSNKSQHYKGLATDFHFIGISFPRAITLLEETIDELGVSDLIGLGIYPYWKKPGFHIDARGKKARWGRLKGANEYVSYDIARKIAFKIG